MARARIARCPVMSMEESGRSMSADFDLLGVLACLLGGIPCATRRLDRCADYGKANVTHAGLDQSLNRAYETAVVSASLQHKAR